jgi:hypothetical protein
MGVASVRFNSKEEKALKVLAGHFHCDYSTLIKRSLWELYEDMKDNVLIEEYERREKKNQVKFFAAEDLMK